MWEYRAGASRALLHPRLASGGTVAGNGRTRQNHQSVPFKHLFIKIIFILWCNMMMPKCILGIIIQMTLLLPRLDLWSEWCSVLIWDTLPVYQFDWVRSVDLFYLNLSIFDSGFHLLIWVIYSRFGILILRLQQEFPLRTVHIRSLQLHAFGGGHSVNFSWYQVLPLLNLEWTSGMWGSRTCRLSTQVDTWTLSQVKSQFGHQDLCLWFFCLITSIMELI